MKPSKRKKLVQGKLVIYRYKDTPNNRREKIDNCVFCDKQHITSNMIKFAINEKTYYQRSYTLYICKHCYPIFIQKIITFENMEDLVRTIELEYELGQLHKKHKKLKRDYDELEKEYANEYLTNNNYNESIK